MSIQVPLKKSRFHSSSVLPLFVLTTLLIQIVLLFLIFFQGSQINSLANAATKTMVQMADGQVVQVSATDACYRSPVAIQNFVNTWALLNYTWNDKLPPANPEQAKNPIADPGVVVGKSKVPTATANAAFLITDKNDFRRQYLEKLATLVPQGVFAGYQETVFHFEKTLLPKQVEACKWDVNIYAYLDVLERGIPIGEPIGLNQKITLEAVPPSIHPLPNSLSPLQQTIYRLGVSGLMIKNIEELPE